MSLSAIKARWGLFGHVMRIAHDTSAQMAIDEYITPTATAGWQGRPRTTLPTTLDNDLQGVGKRLRNKQDLQHLRTFASDRNQWRILPGNYESGTSETDSLIVRQQRESVTDDNNNIINIISLCKTNTFHYHLSLDFPYQKQSSLSLQVIILIDITIIIITTFFLNKCPQIKKNAEATLENI